MSATATVPPSTTDAAATESPKRSKKLLLVVAAVLVGVLSGVGYLVFLRGDAPDAAAADIEPAPVEGEVVEVGTLTTNLGGASGRYARVGVALVLRDDADPAAVEEDFPLVKDAAISEIGSHDVASLAAPDGTEQLRAGLAERIREVYPDGEVLRVVLTELLIQ